MAGDLRSAASYGVFGKFFCRTLQFNSHWLLVLFVLCPGRAEEVAEPDGQMVFVASDASPCGQRAEVWDIGGWRQLESCSATRNAHFGAYHCEAMALPALVTLGSAVKRALVLGGPDGCIATQLLKSRNLQEVVIVSNDTGITEAAHRYMHSFAVGLQDARTTLVVADPQAWLADAPSGTLFDLIVVDEIGSSDLLPPEPEFSPEYLVKLMSPSSLLVQYGASIWHLPRVRLVFDQLGNTFSTVSVLSTSSIDRDPWHEVFFVAGSKDLFVVDWDWWDRQEAHTVFFHRRLHAALLVPAATVSRALGLQLPTRPDGRAAQQLGTSQEPLPDLVSYQFRQPQQEDTTQARKNSWGLPDRSGVLLQVRSKFQNVEVLQRNGFVSLYLDGELQLTDRFGDFYHEALVHPAMAAIGPNGRRALIIGGGDGGVGSLLLKYPLESITQIEIDKEVIGAARRFMPGMSRSYSDPRHKLIVGDALQWVREQARAGRHLGEYDLCIIDTTDDPLVSLWNPEFFQTLRQLITPHGAVVQNMGSMGDWLWQGHLEHTSAFSHTHIISTNSPDYPSPYFLSLSTESLDPYIVNWTWWSELGIETIYYHPTLHEQLFVLPRETELFYANQGSWEPTDAALCNQLDRRTNRRMSAESEL